MRSFRNLSLCCLFIAFTVQLVVGQDQYRTPSPLNKEEKLVFSFAVLGGSEEGRKEFAEVLQKRMEKSGRAVSLADGLNFHPDVCFIFGESEALVREAQECFVQPVVVRLEGGKEKVLDGVSVLTANDYRDAARKAGKLTEKMFYQGMPPHYSTIFENGKDGYAVYRIPSVITVSSGHIVAFAEGRMFEGTDCAENDIVAKVSTDGGRSWGEIIVVSESGQFSLNNPTAVYVEELNRILLLFQKYPPKLNEASAQAGYDGERITRTYLASSDDNGYTWSERRDVTKQIKQMDATGYASGPGVGIRVLSGPDKGRIVMPLNVSGGSKGWFNYLVYSDDQGESWGILPGHSSYGTNESQVVQVSDTDFLMNARCHRFPGDDLLAPLGWNPWNMSKVTRYRGMVPVSITKDEAHWGVTQVREDMPDPLCQGCIFRYSGLQKGEKSRLLFVNPASQFTTVAKNRTMATSAPDRINGTVRVSYDEGKTWSHSKRIYGGRFTEFQYSVLTRLKDGEVGCIFEAHPVIRFAVFDMKWLTSGSDNGKKK